MNINAIVELSGMPRSWSLSFTLYTEEALEAVKQNGYELQYVDFTKETNYEEGK